MNNFDKFMADLDKEITKAEKERDSFAKGVVVKALSDVISSSPVDTGYFRANHFLDVGNVEFRELPKDKDNFKGDSVDRLQDGNETLNNTNLKDGTVITIHNSLDYAQRLEEGHSSQNKHFYRKAKNLADKLIKRGF